MRKLICVIVIIGMVFSLDAALRLSPLEIHPEPSPYISDWSNNPNIVIVRVENTGDVPESVYFKAELTKIGTGRIASGTSETFLVYANSTKSFYNTDFIDYEELQYEQNLRVQIERTGRIPEGEYRLCVSLFDAANNLAGTECANFFVSYPNPPELIYPVDSDTINNPYPLFQWTPTLLYGGRSSYYNFTLVEVEPRQIASHALESAPPILFIENLSSNQYQYGPQDPILEDGKHYAWRVTAIDSVGYPVTTNEGRSNIGEFYYQSPSSMLRTTEQPSLPTSGAPNTGTGTRRLSGKVIDYLSGQPVSGVRVVYRVANPPTRTVGEAVQMPSIPGNIANNAQLLNNLYLSPDATFEEFQSSLTGFNAIIAAITAGLNIGVSGISGQVLPSGWTESSESLWTVTDGQGNFVFLNVQDSVYFSLRGYKENYFPFLAAGSGYRQIGDVDSVVVSITPTWARVIGKVVKRGTNLPIKNCAVVLGRTYSSMLLGTMFLPMYTVLTDSSGMFEFPNVVPGSYEFIVSYPRHRPYVTQLQIFGGATRNLGTIEIQPITGVIQGYVRRVSDSTAISGADVGIWKANSSFTVGVGNFTNANNIYAPFISNSIQNDEPVQIPQQQSLDRTETPSFDNMWNLGGQNLLRDRNINMGLPQSPPVMPTRRTDSNGFFRFENVEINDSLNILDRYNVWAHKPGYIAGYKVARITTDGQVVTVEIYLDAGPGAISGMVIDSTTRGGLGNVKVELLVFSTSSSSVLRLGQATPPSEGGYTFTADRIREESPTPPGGTQPVGSGREVGGAIPNSIYNLGPNFNLEAISGILNLSETEGQIFTTVMETYTNDDGSYTLTPIPNGTYAAVRFSKPGWQTKLRQGPFTVNFGTYIEINETLSVRGAKVVGKVRDESNAPIYGVEILSSNFDATSTTGADGSYSLYPVPKTTVIIRYSHPGFAEKLDTVNVNADSVTHDVTLTRHKGNYEVLVKDSTTMGIIVGASVQIVGVATKLTNSFGIARFDSITAGSKEVKIIGPATFDYVIRNYTVTIKPDSTVIDTIYLKRGGRLVGTVVDTLGYPVENAEVFVDGSSNLKDTTDYAGNFTIRGVPAGIIKLKASKSGFITATLDSIQLSEGELKSGLVLVLRQAFVQTIYGFEVSFDSVKTLQNGNKQVTGYVVNIPNNPALKTKDSGQKLRFVNVELNPSGVPVAGKLQFVETEVDVKLFGIEGFILKDSTGLYARWDSAYSRGVIPGELMFKAMEKLSRIPGTQWADEKIVKPISDWLKVSLTSDGGYSGPWNLGLNVTGTTISFKFFGFTISVDYTKTKVDTLGLHYYGTIQIPTLPAITFEDLTISKEFEFVSVGVKTTPPIQIPLGIITVIDSQTVWDASGFKARGAIRLQLGNTTNYGFNNLWIDPDGKFLSVTITTGTGQNINIFGATLTINGLGFGTDTENKKYFMFTGALSIPNFSGTVSFTGLKIREDGQITGSIYPNLSRTFWGFLSVNISEVRFDKDQTNNKRYVGVYGNISLSIPGVQLQAGNFVFYEDGTFSVGSLGFGFQAGPVEVSLYASWSNGVFAGGGSLNVPPAFSCAADFRYGGSTNWWIKIKAGVVIPIGPVTIVNIAGELGRNGNAWTFGFGGAATIASASAAIRLDLYVLVNPGPVINGTATLTLFQNLQLANANITLDFPAQRFCGNVNFGFNKYGVQFTQWVGFEVKTGQYWYVGGGATINILKLATIYANIYAGKDYPGWQHSLDVIGHPNYSNINGIHTDVSASLASFKIKNVVTVNASFKVYAIIDWYNGQYSGALKYSLNASFDIWIVAMYASALLQAYLAYNAQQNKITFTASASVSLVAWVGCCNQSSACWWPPCLPCDCKWYQLWCCTPCGEKGCFNASLSVAYDGNNWSWNANW